MSEHLPLDTSQWTDDQKASVDTHTLREEERVARGMTDYYEETLDKPESVLTREEREASLRKSQAKAEEMQDRARKVIDNIHNDRQGRVEQALSEGRSDTTVYDPELAHLEGVVMDHAETAMAKERKKKKPNQDLIEAHQDDADRLSRLAAAEYSKNPLVQPEDFVKMPREGLLKRLGRKLNGK